MGLSNSLPLYKPSCGPPDSPYPDVYIYVYRLPQLHISKVVIQVTSRYKVP